LTPKVYQVGGCVRDRLLNTEPKDLDYVVVGADDAYMIKNNYERVGADFPVYIHPLSHDEYALARMERSTGDRYEDFEFDTSTSVTLEDDLMRRDLTMNAIAYDQEADALVDPYNGIADINNKVIRHTSDHFSEDPVRALRVARFAARYSNLGFVVHEETLSLMRQMAEQGMLDSLTPERIYKELSRALTEPSPDVFFTTLDSAGCLQILFPEIFALKGQTQPEKHHPEIDTFVHQMMVLQQARKLTDSVDIMFAALCHDFGKGLTKPDLLPKHHGHEKSGVPLVESFCNRIRAPRRIKRLSMLTSELHTHVHRSKEITAKAFLKLLNRFDVFRNGEALFSDFVVACEADAKGRKGFEDRNYPQANIAIKVMAAAKAVTWDKELLLSIPAYERSGFIYRERLNRIKHELNKVHENDTYKQYREQYQSFDTLSALDKLNMLILDKANYHSCYVEQTLAIGFLSEETQENIRKAVSLLQIIERNFDNSVYPSIGDARVAKRNMFTKAINNIDCKINTKYTNTL
jgi:tRNA nucleotidyltransferase (CCA-adding enzyme)